MAFSCKQRRKIPVAGATVNISLHWRINHQKSVTCMYLICHRIVKICRSKNKQIIINFLH
ncbi:MAG TPA: glyceraldehyde-3-phosphate dehydrogenase [Leclercia adecarboxylata]|nr:glyceraldehyde-3-phosphate dehydrogenase [Leclercia adecarboxylata]HBQ65264.1 glyceraldehyde-3-phosphate dehydrogenase [Leclercia adecarboxylata]